MIYLTLLYEFFKIGLFAIGGGLATLPFIQDFASRTGLITQADIANMIAISEATPGPIGINSATYFGYTIGGVPGAIIATIGLILPSFIIILVISRMLDRFRQNKFVDGALYGLRPASTALIAAAGYSVFQLALLDLERYSVTKVFLDIFNLPAIILAVIIFVANRVFKGHPVIYLAGSAVVGILLKF